VQNSASAFDLDQDIVVDGVNCGAPLANLAGAMQDAGLTSVDAWIVTGGLAVAQLIVPVIHPKVYIPNRWDGLFSSSWPGMPFPFKDDNLKAYLASDAANRPGLAGKGGPGLNHLQKGQLPGRGASIRRTAPSGIIWNATSSSTSGPSLRMRCTCPSPASTNPSPCKMTCGVHFGSSPS
jgi:hypothetical protein